VVAVYFLLQTIDGSMLCDPIHVPLGITTHVPMPLWGASSIRDVNYSF